MATSDSNADHLKSKGNEFYSKGDYETAVVYYKNASLADASNPVHLANMSMALLKLERWQDALSACNKALAIMEQESMSDNKVLQKVQWRKNMAQERLAGTEKDTSSISQNVRARYRDILIEEVDDLPEELQ
ncbi:AaceriAAR054Cp [[Ashbya] aceris (nom. inval.)]|nr:AaceriAAR054Cp [[Ashbya] aceris (nom. inval.)]